MATEHCQDSNIDTWCFMSVLGSAGIELIFTRKSWEGTHPGQMTQTRQTNGIFNTMWRHAQYVAWRAGWRGIVIARERAGHWVMRKVHCVFLALYILFVSIIVVIVFFLCCYVKLSLSQPTSFAFFFQLSSPSHRGGGRWGEATKGPFFVAVWG